MKTIRLLSCLFLLCTMLSACEKTPNMTELLAYETEACVYRLSVRDGSVFSAELTTAKEGDRFTLTDGKTAGISFVFSSEDAALRYEELEIPLPENAPLRVAHWHTLFHLHEKNFLWRIRKETFGGIAVYRCEAEEASVYIDAVTRLPLKLVSGEVEIDILSCEMIEKPHTEQ